MKKRIVLILIVMLIWNIPNSTYANNGISVMIDNKIIEFEISPQIINDRTMVPMRKIFETLDSKVEWIEQTKMILAVKGDKMILLQIGQESMIVKNLKENTQVRVDIDSAPVIENDTTFVPIRAISESLGMVVEWDGVNSVVHIFTNTN